jgi:hypothetical protein
MREIAENEGSTRRLQSLAHLFNVLAVLVQGSGAEHLQLPTGKCWFAAIIVKNRVRRVEHKKRAFLGTHLAYMMLDMSMAPSPLPSPKIWCISSTKRMYYAAMCQWPVSGRVY